MFRELVIDFGAIASGGIAFGSMLFGLGALAWVRETRRALALAGLAGLSGGVAAVIVTLMEALL